MDILQSYRKLKGARVMITNTILSMLPDEPNLEYIKNCITNAKNLINEAELLLSEPEPAAGEKEPEPGSEQVKGCTCKEDHGLTTVACCNKCGLPQEKWWISQ